MKHIKVYKNLELEETLEEFGMTKSQAHTLGAVVRSVIGDVINDRKKDEIRFRIKGIDYELKLESK